MNRVFQKWPRTVAFLLLGLAFTFSSCRTGDPVPQGTGEGYGVITRSLVAQKNSALAINLLEDDTGKRISAAAIEIVAQVSHGAISGEIRSGQAIYSPFMDYVGPDSFTYNLLDSNAEILVQIVAMIDVRPCFRVPVNRPNATNTHIVSIAVAGQGAPNTSSSEAIDRKGRVVVHLKKSSEPATLYLNSWDAVHWELDLEEGASINKVVAQSGFPEITTVGGVEASLVTVRQGTVPYSFEPFALSGNFFGEFGAYIERHRQEEGKNETSFQGCTKGLEFEIPFTAASLSKSCVKHYPSHYDFADQNCENKCRERRFLNGAVVWTKSWLPGLSNTPVISADGLTVIAGSTGSAAIGSLGRSCGKHYFEIAVSAHGAIQTPLNQLGVTQSPFLTETGPFGLNPQKLVETAEWTFGDPITFHQGDIFGIAIDMDAGTIAFRQNDTWLLGADPNNGQPGHLMGLYTYDSIFPVAAVTEGSEFTGHFNASSLYYTAPTGYTAGWE